MFLMFFNFFLPIFACPFLRWLHLDWYGSFVDDLSYLYFLLLYVKRLIIHVMPYIIINYVLKYFFLPVDGKFVARNSSV